MSKCQKATIKCSDRVQYVEYKVRKKVRKRDKNFINGEKKGNMIELINNSAINIDHSVHFYIKKCYNFNVLVS